MQLVHQLLCVAMKLHSGQFRGRGEYLQDQKDFFKSTSSITFLAQFCILQVLTHFTSFLHSTIPDICHFFYTTTFWGLKILHSKVRKFTTKIASRQNSVNHHSRAKFHIYFKQFKSWEEWEGWLLLPEPSCHYWVQVVSHCVENYALCGKIYTLKLTFDLPSICEFSVVRNENLGGRTNPHALELALRCKLLTHGSRWIAWATPVRSASDSEVNFAPHTVSNA